MGVKNTFTNKNEEVEKNWSQILAVFLGGLAGLTNGLLFAWPSPFIVKITADKENYDIAEEEAAYFSIIQPLSQMFACLIFARFIDIIGRKKTLLLIVIPQLSSWLLAAFARSKYIFYLSRICSGLADGCLFVSLPVYIGEITNPEVRGKWGNVTPTTMYLGELFINIIGSYFSVQATSYMCLPLPIIFFVLFSLMPESPYYLIIKGDEEGAKRSLRFLKQIKHIDPIFNQLKKDVERQISESGTWLDIIKIKSNRRALLAGLFLRFSQQLSGYSVFLSFTQLIFQKSGGNLSHDTSSIIYLAICLALNLVAMLYILPNFNRLTCYVSSCGLCCITMLTMAVHIYIEEELHVDVSGFNWIPLASMIGYQIFACYGIAVIPTLMLSELFSASIKSKAMTLLSMAFGLGIFASGSIFYQMNVSFGFYSPFFFFAACCAVSTVLSYYLVPETRGKTLEEIQQMLKNK